MSLCSKCGKNPKHLKLSYCKKCKKEYMKKYTQTYKWEESQKKSRKKYYQKNKNKFKKQSLKWRENNLEQSKRLNKEWVKNNPDRVKQHQQKYRQNYPHYKIRNLFHNLKKNGFYIESKPEYLIIKEHIENQFSEGINWKNIEIDHKIPITWFINSTPYEIINDLRNLHPLIKKENREKAALYCHPINIDYFNLIIHYIKKDRIKKIKEIIFS